MADDLGQRATGRVGSSIALILLRATVQGLPPVLLAH
jgi:hypothetical protein